MRENGWRMHDARERPLRDLRISVTDRCNFRCQYCMPEEIFAPDFPFLEQNELLTFEEITFLAQLFADLGVEKIRITGGEPLLRPNLHELIYRLKSLVPDVTLTTNGSLLHLHAKHLKEAGLDRINVSLDSLDEQRFRRINGGRCSVETVLRGIEAAADVGLKVKVNMVVQKGVNDQDVLPMARHFRQAGHVLRFIEFMDVGNCNRWNLDQVVTKQEIVRMISEEMPLEPIESNYTGEVADRYRYQGSQDEIGVISSISEPFCADCNRARLSADGKLYTCLFAAEGTDLRKLIRSSSDPDQIRETIVAIWKNRNDRYSEERLGIMAFSGKRKIEMHYIGG